MKNRLDTNCWSERAPLVLLSRDSKRYVNLAQDILDAVPDDWDHVSIAFIIDRRGKERCEVKAACGSPCPADSHCLASIRRAIFRNVISGALIPDGLEWAGFWIDYDIEGEKLIASTMHGDLVKKKQEIIALNLGSDLN